MDIRNLLERQHETDVRDAKSSSHLKHRYMPNTRGMPSGNFSAVKDDSKDPHMIKKFSKRGRSDEDEGFKAFVMFLYNNGFDGNIHMPRVYDIKTITGRDGITIDSYRMEKLISLRSVSREELVAYAEMMSDKIDVADDVDTDFIPEEIAYFLKAAIAGRTQSKMESLNEACNIVARAERATGATLDLTTNNIMFRRTSQGLQLVFSDPLYMNI